MAVVVLVGGAVGIPALGEDDDVGGAAERIGVDGAGAQVDVGVVTRSLLGGGTVEVPDRKVGGLPVLLVERLNRECQSWSAMMKRLTHHVNLIALIPNSLSERQCTALPVVGAEGRPSRGARNWRAPIGCITPQWGEGGSTVCRTRSGSPRHRRQTLIPQMARGECSMTRSRHSVSSWQTNRGHHDARPDRQRTFCSWLQGPSGSAHASCAAPPCPVAVALQLTPTNHCHCHCRALAAKGPRENSGFETRAMTTLGWGRKIDLGSHRCVDVMCGTKDNTHPALGSGLASSVDPDVLGHDLALLVELEVLVQLSDCQRHVGLSRLAWYSQSPG